MEEMKLWLISQDVVGDWDTYDSAVVAAETEWEAKMIHPNGSDSVGPNDFPSWATDPKDIECELLGVAKPGTEKGVICSSFNAG